MRTLLIDDEPFVMSVLAHQLSRVGIDDTVCCDNAEAALEILGDGKIDLLFCDLNMPGMDGVEFLRHLGRLKFDGGVVLLSGVDDRILRAVGRLATGLQLRLLATLPKPASMEQIEKAVADWRSKYDTARTARILQCVDREELRTAITGGQLVNHYQPQVSLVTGRLVGVEALVRWKHPTLGLLPPVRFIQAAEDAGWSEDLTWVVLAAALEQARAWAVAGLPLRIAVNVPMDCMRLLELPDRINGLMQTLGLPPERLMLEITESMAASDSLALLDIASRLRMKGIGLAIDDFGTGYSSLAQLRDVPFDELKLDRTFVNGASGDPELRAMIEANLAMARQLGLRVVAEGVEEVADWALLRSAGCDVAQGYLIGRPMPGADLPGWVQDWQRRSRPLLECQGTSREFARSGAFERISGSR